MFKIIFAGTPEIALPSLQALIDSTYSLCAVYTQPDRPAGRGRELTASPVKLLAAAHQIPVFQPRTLRDKAEQEHLKSLQPDLMVVMGYGLLLPKAVLDIPKYGCINIHTSLLPRWRGASPIQQAIVSGDTETGVCIMQMDEGLDTGPVLNRISCVIEPNDTSVSLSTRLAQLGAEALLMTLVNLEMGRVKSEKQNSEEVYYAPKIQKQDGKMDWNKKAIELDRQIRAFNPWPIAFTTLHSEIVRVWQAEVISQVVHQVPGTILHIDKKGIDVATGENVLRLLKLQLPGGKILPVQDILNAKRERWVIGDVFQ
ncbi:MAG: methionyl-tRNA formyltransferase [Proteobacteria bacterium]|nr:methionyl-tRNA formyltransferase [Pseudomonadota bacterium]